MASEDFDGTEDANDRVRVEATTDSFPRLVFKQLQLVAASFYFDNNRRYVDGMLAAGMDGVACGAARRMVGAAVDGLLLKADRLLWAPTSGNVRESARDWNPSSSPKWQLEGLRDTSWVRPMPPTFAPIS